MKIPESDFGPSALEEQATNWICEREEGFSPARAREFALWCAADARHAAAVARVEQTLALLDELPAVRAPLEERFGRILPAAASDRSRVIRFRFAAWAAGMAAALVVGAGAWQLAKRPAAKPEQYVTAPGLQRTVTLVDGSRVDLNGDSRIEVAFVGRERRVALQSGEAHFQVAHDASRPFIVSARGVAVRAVGTAFNVQLASTEVSVLVTEGKVEVKREHPAQTSPAVAAEPARSSLLVANERTVVPTAPTRAFASPGIERVSPEKIRELLAWQNPVATFTDAPLRDVVAQFNRRNATQLILADAALGERKIGAVIALDQVEDFVRLLEQDGDVVAAPRGEREIVLRRAR